MQTHETISSFRKVTPGSTRKFGLTFGVVFFVFGAWPLIHAGSPRWGWLLGCAAILGVTLVAPARLAPLNRAWFRLGLGLGRIVNPIVMGILFFGAVVPFGLYIRRRNKSSLNRPLDPAATTYWLERDPPGPTPGNSTKQF